MLHKEEREYLEVPAVYEDGDPLVESDDASEVIQCLLLHDRVAIRPGAWPLETVNTYWGDKALRIDALIRGLA